MERTSVFLSDWQVLFREGIHFTLSGEEDIDVIGEATSSEDALKAIEANPPDIAVLNTNHEKTEGIQAAGYLRRHYPSVATVLIMDSENEEELFLAMESGASACLTKGADPLELIDTIKAVAHGERPITYALLRPEIASRVLDEFEEFDVIGEQLRDLLARLTPGETEILHRLANGAPVDEVYETLGITEEGINRAFGIILTKLITNEQSRQVIAATQSGLPPAVRSRLAGKESGDYITREEFTAFKDSFRERLKSAIDETR